mgnify:FL=1
MKKNLLPFAALMFLCAVFFVAAGAFLLFPSLPLSDLPTIPTFLPLRPF